MIKRILIICEGPTEAEFCNDILVPHFFQRQIFVHTPLIKKNGGGIVSWEALKHQIEKHLKQDSTAFVTTFIDFYGIHDKFKFPNWEGAKAYQKMQRLNIVEVGMKNDLNAHLRERFIPYIQLHEFEGLLFNNIESFENQISPNDFVNKAELIHTIESHANPELINDSPNNAPSYRLQRLIRGYNKIVYGSILAQDIGLDRIRQKSLRFNNWIQTIEDCWNK